VNRTVLALCVAGLLAPAAPAVDLGLGIFKRKPKTDTADRVKQLVATLQSDPDEKKRSAAVEELRGLDPRQHADVVPALVGSLQRDPAPAVRAEAAEALGKIKPVTQPVALALEAVQANDPTPAVREAAKSALFQYHLNGYRSANPAPTGTAQSNEPPFAAPRPVLKTVPSNPVPVGTETGFKPIANGVGKGVFATQTAEPPLAKPKGEPRPATPLPAPAPAPALVPANPPTIAVPPPPPTIKPPPLATPGSGF
jgi:hypothetical protein